MVRKMVENASGKFQVESQVGIDSTFNVYFKKVRQRTVTRKVLILYHLSHLVRRLVIKLARLA
jgi:hypothetical protein